MQTLWFSADSLVIQSHSLQATLGNRNLPSRASACCSVAQIPMHVLYEVVARGIQARRREEPN